MTITQAFLLSEISSLWPDNTTGAITPANARQTLNDIVTAIFQGATSVSNSDGTLTISPTTGSVIASLNLSNSNTWTGLQIFNNGISGTIPTGLTQAFNFTQSPSGTSGSNADYNQITLTDTANLGGNFGVGLNITHNFGGNSVQGGREAFQATAALTSTTNASSTNRNYVGVTGVGTSITNDNGTSLSPLGAMFGGNFVGALFTGATNFLNVTGCEFNSFIQTGASAKFKTLLQVSADPRDRVQGTTVDSMFWAYNQSASNPGWNTGILFDGVNGTWPIISAGTVLQTLSGTAAHGIDLSNTNFTSDTFKSNGFVVTGQGITGISPSSGTGGNIGCQVTPTQTSPHSSDTNDSALLVDYTLQASSATNQLVSRILYISANNNLTGGGVLQNLRCMDIVTNTNSSTTITNLVNLYLEAGTTSGTVTNGYGLVIESIQGSTKTGIADVSGGNWYNSTGGLSLGNTTAAGNGVLTLGSNGGAAGQITFNGSTSGSASINVSATASAIQFNQQLVVGVNGGNGGAITLAGATSSSGVITVTASTGVLNLGSTSTTVDASGSFASTNVTATNIAYSADIIGQAPATLTGTSGSTSSTSQIINSSGTFTLTLPSASSITGRWLYIKNVAAHALNSASSNVVPLNSTSAGTAITGATAGDWVTLQSDGTNWIVMAGVTA